MLNGRILLERLDWGYLYVAICKNMSRREGIGFGTVYMATGEGGGDPRWRIILDPYVFLVVLVPRARIFLPPCEQATFNPPQNFIVINHLLIIEDK